MVELTGKMKNKRGTRGSWHSRHSTSSSSSRNWNRWHHRRKSVRWLGGDRSHTQFAAIKGEQDTFFFFFLLMTRCNTISNLSRPCHCLPWMLGRPFGPPASPWLRAWRGSGPPSPHCLAPPSRPEQETSEPQREHSLAPLCTPEVTSNTHKGTVFI